MKSIPLRAALALPFALALSTPAWAGPVNGSFESSPAVAGFLITDAANVAGWKTNASDNQIEIWASGYDGVQAYSGNQFAELNANMQSTLYQETEALAAGQTLSWQFAHRGRAGNESVRFTVTDLGANGVYDGGGGDDKVLFSRTVTDGNSAWGFYTGNGIATTGHKLRISFESLNPSSVGNFLDAVDFSVAPRANGVPEPATPWLLAAVGLAALALRRRRSAR